MIIILTPQLSLSTSLSMHACPQKHILSYTIGVKQNICKDGEWVDAPSVVVERARASIPSSTAGPSSQTLTERKLDNYFLYIEQQFERQRTHRPMNLSGGSILHRGINAMEASTLHKMPYTIEIPPSFRDQQKSEKQWSSVDDSLVNDWQQRALVAEKKLTKAEEYHVIVVSLPYNIVLFLIFTVLNLLLFIYLLSVSSKL